jgi:hypothetical protein
MPPNQWGPPTWIFMHTLANSVKDDSFDSIKQQMISFLIEICYNLPCPECANHAKLFWRKVNTSNIKNKIDLVNLLYVFHNTVNKRKNYKPFQYQDLQYYNTKKVVETFNSFTRNFNTRGNMNLINESFYRNRLIISIKRWLMQNLVHFNL